MSPTNHQWTNHAKLRLSEAHGAAAALLISVEAGAHLWNYDMCLLDDAIRDLRAAKALHLARLAEQEKAA